MTPVKIECAAMNMDKEDRQFEVFSEALDLSPHAGGINLNIKIIIRPATTTDGAHPLD